MEDDRSLNGEGIESLFRMFCSAAMNPRPYIKKNPLPARVAAPLAPREMDLLNLISAKIGAPRTNVAHHILKMGLYEAAIGCGFTFDEDGNIPEDQKKWETAPRSSGFSFPNEEQEEI